MISVAQLRAARGLVGWSQSQLAESSGVALSTIKQMESAREPMRSSAEKAFRVQRGLQDAGVDFIDENGGGAGVRLRKQCD